MVDAIDEAMEGWDRYAETGEPFEAYRAFSHVNMNVIVRTMFGADISSEEADIVRIESAIIVDYMLAAMFVHSIPRWLPMPGRRRFEHAVRKVDETIYKLIERHRTHGSGKGGDLIGMLLDSVDAETGSRMTDKQARDEAVSIFLAGYETSPPRWRSPWPAWARIPPSRRPSTRRSTRWWPGGDEQGPDRPGAPRPAAAGAHGVPGNAAPVPGRLLDSAHRRRGRCHRGLPHPRRQDGGRDGLQHPSPPRDLGGTRAVRSVALHAGARGGPAPAGLDSLRGRTAAVHRQGCCRSRRPSWCWRACWRATSSS